MDNTSIDASSATNDGSTSSSSSSTSGQSDQPPSSTGSMVPLNTTVTTTLPAPPQHRWRINPTLFPQPTMFEWVSLQVSAIWYEMMWWESKHVRFRFLENNNSITHMDLAKMDDIQECWVESLEEPEPLAQYGERNLEIISLASEHQLQIWLDQLALIEEWLVEYRAILLPVPQTSRSREMAADPDQPPDHGAGNSD